MLRMAVRVLKLIVEGGGCCVGGERVVDVSEGGVGMSVK